MKPTLLATWMLTSSQYWWNSNISRQANTWEFSAQVPLLLMHSRWFTMVTTILTSTCVIKTLITSSCLNLLSLISVEHTQPSNWWIIWTPYPILMWLFKWWLQISSISNGLSTIKLIMKLHSKYLRLWSMSSLTLRVLLFQTLSLSLILLISYFQSIHCKEQRLLISVDLSLPNT